jgi:membrane protease YdiL (CAAX protease family)
MRLSAGLDKTTSSANRLALIMRRRPLLCFFLLTFGLTWTYELTVYRSMITPGFSLGNLLLGLGFTLGPTVAAFIMTVVTRGRIGVIALLRRYVLWRVGIRWYALVLIGPAVLVLLAVLPAPDALAALRPPNPSFWPMYALFFPVFLVAFGPLFEEPGWRGFALPRLQERSGPLVGTLALGALWGLWHLPLFLIAGTDQYAISIVGAGEIGHLMTFVVFLIWTVALAVVFTWVFNNSRGSLTLVILLHTSVNMALGVVLPGLFPSLPLTALAGLVFVGWAIVWTLTALLVIAGTRGRLSYHGSQREAPLPMLGTE